MSLEYLAGYFLGAPEAGDATKLTSVAASLGATSSSSRVEDVDDRVDRLALVIEAMWSLLEDAGLSADDLKARMEGLSSQFKEAAQPTTSQCASCEAMVPRGHDMCQFCGTRVEPQTAVGRL